jgi:hypothetical protein
MSDSVPEFLYRSPTGEGEAAHMHRIQRATTTQIYVEREAADGTVATSKRKASGTWMLSRGELEHYRSAYHGPSDTRFYLNEEEAEEAVREDTQKP